MFCRQRTIKVLIGVLLVIQSLVLIFNMIPNYRDVQSSSGTVVVDESGEESVNDTVEIFLDEYSAYCEEHLLPKPANIRELVNVTLTGITSGQQNHISLCPCVPDSLRKYRFAFTNASKRDLSGDVNM